MRAGQGRGLDSVIVSARQRAASLLESVASGRMNPDQALSLWPEGRGDDPAVEQARGALRRRPEASALMAAARTLRTEPRSLPARRRTPDHGSALAGVGQGVMPLRTRLALVATGIVLLALSAYWLAATR